MQQPTLTSYFKTKKRTGAPIEDLKSVKDVVSDVNRVQFLKKGNLSPKKGLSPVKTKMPNVDLKRLKAVARNLKDSANKLEKLQEERKHLEDDQRKQELEKKQESEKGQCSPRAIRELSLTAHPSLQLPLRFRVLKLLNEGMNTVASMFQNRNETITYNKLKSAVESMTKHTFSIKTAARMLSIYDYFKILTQKVGNINQYVFEFEVKLLPSQLIRLKKNFEQKLINFCLIEHEKFLKSHNIDVDRTLVTRWHPSFNIEALQIPAAPLPELSERLTSAAEVLNQVREMMQGRSAAASEAAPIKKAPVSKKPLKGISSALLEKIRDREKNRIVRDLTIPHEELKLQKIKARLPELVRMIHNIFVGEKKAAIEFPVFLQRLQFSYEKLTASEVELHVDYLLKTQPAWIQKIKTTTSEYIKINKTIQTMENFHVNVLIDFRVVSAESLRSLLERVTVGACASLSKVRRIMNDKYGSPAVWEFQSAEYLATFSPWLLSRAQSNRKLPLLQWPISIIPRKPITF
ncbi:unnamed protein product [Allacma fusca]|uniref:CDT1 Geminin-binding domain-containing protein n=1 Tax=Allacma fusca TaxID=39272 RepID=A0A8J2L653_9HEXA|nr:unnamed protein product [Allacma fusca]